MRGISYVPYSHDLSHPGDRRRIKIWSEDFKVPLNYVSINPDDVLVLSAAASVKAISSTHKGPVVVDLVDGYLSSKPPFMEDLLRNSIRSFLGKSSFGSVTFSRELQKAISNANAVIVSCEEQAAGVRTLNKNVHCILDDHSELIHSAKEVSREKPNTFTILWEGLGYTLKHLLDVAEDLERFIISKCATLIVVTNPSYKRYATRFGSTDSVKQLRNAFKNSWSQIEFVDWTINSLKLSTERAHIAIIPINNSDIFAMAKPENKLLSYWTLGIPTLCSPTPAYKRVLSMVGQQRLLVHDKRWDSALTEFHKTIQENPTISQEVHRAAQLYLDRFHTREILSRKWDAVLRPLM